MTVALPRLHAVTDDRVIARGGVVERAGAMAREAGAALAVHLRSRDLAGGPLFELAQALADRLGAHGSWLVVNDRADVARLVNAQAIQSGSAGLAVAEIRRVAPGIPVGRSVHDAGEARAAAAEGADFLVAGSVFRTPSHPEREPGGVALVTGAAATGRPVIAIGGLTPARTAEVLAAGAWGVAAVRSLWDADDAALAARAFLAELPAAELLSVVVNGEPRRAIKGTTLAGLLAELALDPRAVVVEHNRHIVRRDDLARTAVGEGDQVELVHFVGGG